MSAQYQATVQTAPPYNHSASAWLYDSLGQGQASANAFCIKCGQPAEVDHIFPHRGDQKLFWDRD